MEYIKGEQKPINEPFEILGHPFKNIDDLIKKVNVRVSYDKTQRGFDYLCPTPQQLNNQCIDDLCILAFVEEDLIIMNDLIDLYLDESHDYLNFDSDKGLKEGHEFPNHYYFFFSTTPFTDLAIGSIWGWLGRIESMPSSGIPLIIYNTLDDFMTIEHPSAYYFDSPDLNLIDNSLIQDDEMPTGDLSMDWNPNTIELSNLDLIKIEDDVLDIDQVNVSQIPVDVPFDILDHRFNNFSEIINNVEIFVSGSNFHYGVEWKSIILDYDENTGNTSIVWPTLELPFHILELRITDEPTGITQNINQESTKSIYYFIPESFNEFNSHELIRNLCILHLTYGLQIPPDKIPIWALPTISFFKDEGVLKITTLKKI